MTRRFRETPNARMVRRNGLAIDAAESGMFQPDRPVQKSCDSCGVALPLDAKLNVDFELWGEGLSRLTVCFPCANGH